jgi:MFS family permease
LISFPAASLSDIFGRRKFLLLAGFVFASAPFLYLLIPVGGWWQLIMVRFYHGFATAIFVPVAEASVAELFPTKRGERISLFSSVTYVGRIIAPALGGYVLLVTVNSFHVYYLAVAVAGVTALIMALVFLAERKQPTATQQRKDAKEIVRRLYRGWRTVAKNNDVLIVSFVQASQFYAFGVVEFFLSGYLPDVAHIDPFLTGIIIASMVFMTVVMKPYMGRISDKTGRRVPITVGCVISALPLLVVPFVTDFWTLLILIVVYGFGFAAVTASTPALISELVPKEFIGTSMGFLDTLMDVGQTLGPIISGFIFAGLQYRGVFPSLTIVVLLSATIFALSSIARANSNKNA